MVRCAKQQKQRTPTRGFLLKQSLIAWLDECLPGFSDIPVKHQALLAYMVWSYNTSKRYAHNTLDDYFSFYCRTREQLFGRGNFERYNKHINLFEVTPGYSKGKSTKGYKLTDKAKVIYTAYLVNEYQRAHDTASRIIDSIGEPVQRRRNGIMSQDSELQQSVFSKAHARIPFEIQINLKAIQYALDTLSKYKDALNYASDMPDMSIFPSLAGIPEHKLPAWIEERTEQLLQLYALAHTTSLPTGFIPLLYIESPSGRLYGKGIHLQNAKTEVKNIALSGCWEYDIENCHYSILDQLATRYDCQLHHVRHYLAHKQAVREQLILDIGLTEKQVKKCLVAVIYGARASKSEQCEITKTIGKDKAGKLYKHSTFAGLHNDVKQCRKIIIENTRHYRGQYQNILGKWIPDSAPNNEILAHVMQGIEARMLQAVIGLYGDDLVLLQHDGWTARKQLNKQDIEAQIQSETGFKVSIEEHQIPII